MISASDSGRQFGVATAVAGGVVAGTGAAATAKEDSTVLAEIGSSATITTTGLGTLVSASATPELLGDLLGVAVGGWHWCVGGDFGSDAQRHLPRRQQHHYSPGA